MRLVFLLATVAMAVPALAQEVDPLAPLEPISNEEPVATPETVEVLPVEGDPGGFLGRRIFHAGKSMYQFRERKPLRARSFVEPRKIKVLRRKLIACMQ